MTKSGSISVGSKPQIDLAYGVAGMMGVLRLYFGTWFVERGMKMQEWLVFLRLAPGMFHQLPQELLDVVASEDAASDAPNCQRTFFAGSNPMLVPTYDDVDGAYQWLFQTAAKQKVDLPALVSPELFWREYEMAALHNNVRFWDGKQRIQFDPQIEPIMQPLAFLRYVGDVMVIKDEHFTGVILNHGTPSRIERFGIEWLYNHS